MHNFLLIFTLHSEYSKHVYFIPRTIDMLDWNSLINDTTKISDLLMVPNLQVSKCYVTVEYFIQDVTAELTHEVKCVNV